MLFKAEYYNGGKVQKYFAICGNLKTNEAAYCPWCHHTKLWKHRKP